MTLNGSEEGRVMKLGQKLTFALTTFYGTGACANLWRQRRLPLLDR